MVEVRSVAEIWWVRHGMVLAGERKLSTALGSATGEQAERNIGRDVSLTCGW